MMLRWHGDTSLYRLQVTVAHAESHLALIESLRFSGWAEIKLVYLYLRLRKFSLSVCITGEM